MNAWQAIRALGPIDIRSVRRDSTLSWMIFLPILSALILRWSVPPLTTRLLARYAFDLTPYYPVLLAYFLVVMTPLTFAVLIGFLLLDEKDDQTLKALQVTPLSLNAYLAYRIAVPVILTFVLMFVIFPLSGLGTLTWHEILVIAITAAPFSPVFALFLASFAQNKVQGFALMKLSGAVLMIPVFAYFVNPQWELAFGLIPTYWPMKVYWMLEAGQTGVWLYVIIAVLYQLAVTAFLAKRFNTIMRQ